MGIAAMTFGSDGTAWLMNSAEGTIEAYAPTPQGRWRSLGVRLTQIRGEDLLLPYAGSGMVTGR